jgi:hypothetical protein
MSDEATVDDAIVRVNNKIKRSGRNVWVYYIKGKFNATTSPDEALLSKLVGVYDSRRDDYSNEYIDQDMRWAVQHMKSFRV